MKVTRSILKQLILETMNETRTGTSSGTPTQDTGDGELARADAAAVVAAKKIIDSLLDSARPYRWGGDERGGRDWQFATIYERFTNELR